MRLMFDLWKMIGCFIFDYAFFYVPLDGYQSRKDNQSLAIPIVYKKEITAITQPSPLKKNSRRRPRFIGMRNVTEAGITPAVFLTFPNLVHEN